MIPGIGQSVALVVAGVVVDQGNELPDWDNPVSVTPVSGCSVQPSVGDVATEHRFAGVTDYSVYLPYWTLAAVFAKHPLSFVRIRYGGTDYDPTAPPLLWAEGPTRHVEIPIRNVTG